MMAAAVRVQRCVVLTARRFAWYGQSMSAEAANGDRTLLHGAKQSIVKPMDVIKSAPKPSAWHWRDSRMETRIEARPNALASASHQGLHRPSPWY